MVFIFLNAGRNYLLLGLNLISLVLFVSPIARAYTISKKLPGELGSSFGKPATHKSEFSFLNFFTMPSKPSEFQTFTYDTVHHLTLDYYQATNAEKRPCVVIVHGGSWSAGDSRQLPEINTFLSKRGYNVASINYRLAPEHLAPAPIEDIVQTLRFLSNNSDQLKIDSSHYFLLGRSAGGQIVLQAAYSLKDKRIKGVISLYGPADMIWGYQNPSSKLIMDSKKVMEDYLGGSLDKMKSNYVSSSAVEYHHMQVPTLLIHGELDPLVAYEHSVRLNAVLKSERTPHYLLTLPWATHGCEYTLHGPSGQLIGMTVEYFLKCYSN